MRLNSSIPVAALLAAALASLTLGGVAADDLFLVRDIDPEPGEPVGSLPVYLGPAGDRGVFSAAVDDLGRELWSVDESGEVTPLGDLCPGLCSGFSRFEGTWRGDGRLYFAAFDDPQDRQRRHAWVTDGTAGGTRRLSTAGVRTNLFAGSVRPAGGGELVLFEAFEADRGFGLWCTDGTPDGTRPLGLDAEPGWPLSPYGPVMGGETAVFGAFLAEIGSEPWVTDGSDAGTRLLGDLRAGPDSSIPHNVARLPHGWVFIADDEIHGEELWFSDGTPAGTRLIADLAPGPAKTHVWSRIVTAGGVAWLIASLDELPPRQLWRSDGTAAGTQQLTDFPAGTGFPTTTSVLELAPLGDAVLFAGDDGIGGLELWRADASSLTSFDLCPGPCSSSPGLFRRLGDAVFFSADDGVAGREPWISDGTVEGTRRIADLCPGPCGAQVQLGLPGQERLFFRVGSGGVADELWVTDGSEAGTERLTVAGDLLLLRPVDASPWGEADGFAGDLYVFTAYDEEHGFEQWGSDGTPEGTRLLADLVPRTAPGAGSDPRHLTPFGDQVFFVADDGVHGPEPWLSDGTPEGTRLLAEVVAGADAADGNVVDVRAFAGRIAFVVGRADLVAELWVSDGTPEGTELSLDWETRFPLLSPRRLLSPLGDAVLLRAGGGLWRSDGTAAGTVLLHPLEFLGSRLPTAVLGGELFFAAGEVQPGGGGDFDLWASDGTAAGTRVLRDVHPPHAMNPTDLVSTGDILYFTATDALSGRRLWVTDGTPEGARVVPGVPYPATALPPRPLAAVGDRLLFAVDELDRFSVWVTDGTGPGTRRLIDRPIDPSASVDERFARLHDRLYLVTGDSLPTSEVWSTDGTVSGTRRQALLLPPGSSALGLTAIADRLLLQVYEDGRSQPFSVWESDGQAGGYRRLSGVGSLRLAEVVEAGGLVFATALHPEAGWELMAFDPARPAGETCRAGIDTLCLAGGRFSARVAWRDPRSGDTGEGGALALPGSDRSGLFWFFDAANVELVLKLLDGGAVNGFRWAFYGALSDVEYWIEIFDHATGRRRLYYNPPFELCGRGDTRAFPADEGPPAAAIRSRLTLSSSASAAAATTACGGGPEDLCLLDDRFRVAVTWRDQRSGDSGVGTAITGTGKSGFFWFFEPQNVELVVKVLDGRPVNGRFWVFYGALTDVEYTITVTDTESGEEASYTNPPGEICGRGDTTAF